MNTSEFNIVEDFHQRGYCGSGWEQNPHFTMEICLPYTVPNSLILAFSRTATLGINEGHL